jgi:hypothetical protein
MNSITSLAGHRRIATKPDALQAEVDALKRLQAGTAPAKENCDASSANE